jgi:hypothetical protein
MLHIRPHLRADYDELPDIDAEGIATLTHAKLACLDELGALLVEQGMEDRFGVTLLHRHFVVNDGEVMLERSNLDRMSLLTRPEFLNNELRKEAVPIIIMAGADHEFVALEYAPVGELRVSTFRQDDSSTLESMFGVLRSRQALHPFGIRLINSGPHLEKGRVWVETCDKKYRELTCVGMAYSDEHLTDAIETNWRWERSQTEIREPGDPPIPLRACTRSCDRKCRVVGGYEPNLREHRNDHDEHHTLE